MPVSKECDLFGTIASKPVKQHIVTKNYHGIPLQKGFMQLPMATLQAMVQSLSTSQDKKDKYRLTLIQDAIKQQEGGK